RVDPDTVRPHIAGKSPRQAFYCRLGRGITGHIALALVPTHGPQVDDRATSEFLHMVVGCLGGEKYVTQVDINALIPVFNGDVTEVVAKIAGGIIDQNAYQPKLLPDLVNYRAQLLDI